MKKAYSHQRFSSIKQQKGDSTVRQDKATMQFCKQYGLTLVDTFRDKGVSAFKGKNFSNESALAEFLRLVESGTVTRGSVLVIENMDRLSRQSLLPCVAKFTEIITKGVAIGVISQNRIYDTKSITDNPFELVLVLVEFMRANNESQTKSTRVKSVIQSKIERVTHGEKVWFGVHKPSWITGLKSGTFILDNQKTALVRSIFARYLSGHSCSNIANQLNNSKTPTLRSIPNGIWTNSTVGEVLRNRNVIGWFGINGQEFEDYFPAIISPAEFKNVQTRLAINTRNRGGSKYGLVRNLFKGLAYCAECGQVLELKIGSYQSVHVGTHHYAHYICRGVKQHTGCKNRGRVTVSSVELAIFETVLFKHPKELITPAPQINTNILTKLQNQLAKAQLTIDRLTDMVSDVDLQDVSGLKEKLKRAAIDRQKLLQQITTESNRITQQVEFPKATLTLLSILSYNKPALKEYAAWYADYNRFIQSTENRKLLRNVMPSVFERITLRFIQNAVYPSSLETDIHCTLIDGGCIDAKVITSREHIIIRKNDPRTGRPTYFRANQAGERFPASPKDLDNSVGGDPAPSR